ncbi:MAG: fumarylacetoacetate hydrolase family protein [Actinomycetota bacterium]|nr:fumarylacetoacetate hydrolase family protein [Actinomycetota bacterium]
MHLVRYQHAGALARPGILEDGEVRPLEGVASLEALWALPASEFAARCRDGARTSGVPLAEVELLAPIDGRTEVWASGVTYEISREARMEESEAAADIYRLVYDAERPELFFKAVSWKVSGPDGPLGIREDSPVNVPEPELAIVCNAAGEIVGYSICNDCSSRSIEGENPLYLPQAKVYAASCALGPGIRPAFEVPDPYALSIALRIVRGDTAVFDGVTSTARLHRRLDELAGYLFRADRFPSGAVLSTGTCLVPETPFTLEAGDEVEVTIEALGTLTNRVVRGLSAST